MRHVTRRTVSSFAALALVAASVVVIASPASASVEGINFPGESDVVAGSFDVLGLIYAPSGAVSWDLDHNVGNTIDAGPLLDADGLAHFEFPFTLPSGPHTIYVSSPDTGTLTRSFTVDADVPTLVITSPTDGQVVHAGDLIDLLGVLTDVGSVNWDLKVDGITYTSGNNDAAGGVQVGVSSYDTTGLDVGPHTVGFQLRDAVGNENYLGLTFTIAPPESTDTGPTLAIASPTAGADYTDSLPISVQSTDPAGVLSVTAELRPADAGACSTDPFVENQIPRVSGDEFTGTWEGAIDLSGHPAGSYCAALAATNTDGVVSTITLVGPFTISTPVPAQGTITAPSDGQTLTNKYVHVTGDLDDHSGPLSYTIDGGDPLSISMALTPTGPVSFSFNSSALTEGTHTIVVSSGSFATAPRSFAVDLAPRITDVTMSATTVTAGEVVSIGATIIDSSAVQYEVWLGDDLVYGDTYLVPFIQGISTSGLAAAEYEVDIRAEDAQGNVSWHDEYFTVEAAAAPTVGFTTEADSQIRVDNPLAGVYGGDITSIEVDVFYEGCEVLAAAPVFATRDAGAWSVDLPRDLNEAKYCVQIVATDASDATASDSRNFWIDTVSPAAPTWATPSGWVNVADALTWQDTGDYEPNFYTYEVYDAADNYVTSATVGAAQANLDSPLAGGEYHFRVQATDLSGNVGEWSDFFSFGVTGTPFITSPHDADTFARNVRVNWYPVQAPPVGVDHYQVQFRHPDSSTVYNRNVTALTPDGLGQLEWSGAVPNAAPQGDWRIRVRAVFSDAVEGSTNGLWSDWVDVVRDSIAPDAPTLTLPAADWATANKHFAFGWDYVSDARYFELRYATTDATNGAGRLVGGTTVVTGDYETYFDARNLSGGFPDGDYYWQVRGIEQFGSGADTEYNNGAWSAPRHLVVDRDAVADTTAPVITVISPIDGGYVLGGVTETTVSLSIDEWSTWSVRLDTRGTVASGSGFGGTVTFPVDFDEWDGSWTHIFVFYATDSAGNFSSTYVTVTGDTGAPSVAITSPAPIAAGGTLDVVGTASDETSGVDNVAVSLYGTPTPVPDESAGGAAPAAPAPCSVIVASGLATLTDGDWTAAIDTSGLKEGWYCVEALATDAVGNDESTEFASVFVDHTGPGVVTLDSPSNGSSRTSDNVTLGWSAPADSDEVLTYEYELGTSSAIVAGSLDGSIAGTGIATLSTLVHSLPNGTYYWHVRAIDAVGNAGDWSEVWHLTIAVPAAPPTIGGHGHGHGLTETPTPDPTATPEPTATADPTSEPTAEPSASPSPSTEAEASASTDSGFPTIWIIVLVIVLLVGGGFLIRFLIVRGR